jgi:hypothetical protein
MPDQFHRSYLLAIPTDVPTDANGRWYNEMSRLLLPLGDGGGGEAVAFVTAADYPAPQFVAPLVRTR